MKKYIGTKVIGATPMNRGDYNEYRGWPIPADENPADEGYLVKYSDDYVSWSPKAVFDEAYNAFDEGMPFGAAIELLKKGYKVTRKVWNDNGYIFLSDKEKNEITLMSNNKQYRWNVMNDEVFKEDWIIVE